MASLTPIPEQLAALALTFKPYLVLCDDCSGQAELVVTPDPLYGNGVNAEAGWIGYYAVECTQCGIPVPGDRWFNNTLDGGRIPLTERLADPVTLDDHKAAMENAAAVWNGFDPQ